MKHIFREHNRILGAEGQRTVVVANENDTDKWKMVRGIWDGSSQVRIKAVDKDKRITISRIAVPLKMCTAMAAEVAGARVLTGILDLVLGKISV